MNYFSAIDLHSNNLVLVILDEQDRSVVEKRIDNSMVSVLAELEPYRADIKGVAVESTFNWYWLVDGLMSADYPVHLVNPAAVQTYSGLKYSNDVHDARWLAKLLHLNILPTGYIYPKEQRKVRDLLRKRSGLVHQRSQNIASFKCLFARQRGVTLSLNAIHKDIDQFTFNDPLLEASGAPHKHIYHLLTEEITELEKIVSSQLNENDVYEQLQTVQE